MKKSDTEDRLKNHPNTNLVQFVSIFFKKILIYYIKYMLLHIVKIIMYTNKQIYFYINCIPIFYM